VADDGARRTFIHLAEGSLSYRAFGALVDDALARHLREHLAPYKQPTGIVSIDELPINANGKIMKRLLRERLGT